MSNSNHKIVADDRTVSEVLSEKKYTVDFFQREYSWTNTHIEQLVTDLTSSFLAEYTKGDERVATAGYNNYFLGPFVVNSKDGTRSIIDGQQRLTSLTLLLIFLHNRQKTTEHTESIESLIFSEKYGKKSFNIDVPDRAHCLQDLLESGVYEVQSEDDESTVNIVERYADIELAFPDEIDSAALPYFLDWLKYNVILVEIQAYSDDNAYSIFESMNDRGQNLTSTEMLKGFILSRYGQGEARDRANSFWKDAVKELHSYSKDEDLRFFQAWLRSQYAESIRKGQAGSSNEDFEKIGTRFHSWFRDNLSKMNLGYGSSQSFERFVDVEMRHYYRAYIFIMDAQKSETDEAPHVFYREKWGVADSLSLPLMLAPLTSGDTEEITKIKIDLVARFLETFAVRRHVNFRNISASSIRYTMYTLVKEIRGKTIDELREILAGRVNQMDETWDGIRTFRLHGNNKRFVRYLLSRISAFVDHTAGVSTKFVSYFDSPGAKKFEIEHLWADKFEEHRFEFDQQNEFESYRNRIGCLVLLPQGTNQSLNDLPYKDKLEHYLKENLYVKSLHPTAYINNPNFTSNVRAIGLPFRAHEEFNKSDAENRQELVQKICERIWDW